MKRDPNSTIRAILKELGLKKGSGLARLDIVGNLAVEQMVKIALDKRDRINAKSLKDAVKVVAGACVPMGILCEGMSAKEFAKKVDEGVYDDVINNKITKVSEEKKKVLADQLKKAQAKVAPELNELRKKMEAKAQKEAQKQAKKKA